MELFSRPSHPHHTIYTSHDFLCSRLSLARHQSSFFLHLKWRQLIKFHASVEDGSAPPETHAMQAKKFVFRGILKIFVDNWDIKG